jgi:hypothetical protein
VKVALRPAPTVGVKVSSTGLQPSPTSSLSLKNTFAGGKSRLDELLDIDLTFQVDGSVPVYNAQIDKYEVKPIDVSVTNLDGGTF